MLKRTGRASFAGGMCVFPGGRVDGEGHLYEYDAVRTGPADQQAAQVRALGAGWRGYCIAGIRASFEEPGLLLAYRDGKPLSYAGAGQPIAAANRRFPVYRPVLPAHPAVGAAPESA